MTVISEKYEGDFTEDQESIFLLILELEMFISRFLTSQNIKTSQKRVGAPWPNPAFCMRVEQNFVSRINSTEVTQDNWEFVLKSIYEILQSFKKEVF